MITVPPFDVSVQFQQIGSEITQAVSAVLASGQYIGGVNVVEFEKEFAQYIGSDLSVACNSGTDALYLALRALGIGAGDRVIVPTFTFFSSAETVSMTGATPVFVDIEADSFNLDSDRLESLITERTKAIMPVHLFGRPADMPKIMAIAQKYNLYVVEDCAQATGATCRINGIDQKVGNIGDLGCFSFYPTKNLGGCGDGGLVTTNNPELAAKIKVLREHGSPQRYFHTDLGMNSRLDAVQAAILRVKLPHLDTWNQLRRQVSDRYDKMLFDLDNLALPKCCQECGNGSVWNQYTVRVLDQNRDRLQAKLKALGITTIIYYPLPIHLQAVYTDLGYGQGDFPISEMVSTQVLSLPMFPEISIEQQELVVAQLKLALAS